MSLHKNNIKKLNKLLIEQFGIPYKNSCLPNPLDMIIATILSQNTNDKNSYQAYKNLKNKFPQWELAVKADRILIEKAIKIAGLGLQKSKAIKNILESLNGNGHISLDYLNDMDNDRIIKELTQYQGVGVKTASCVLLFSLDRNVCPVDTHVHRTLNRIGIISANTPDKTFWLINKDFPEHIAHSFHTNLIRLGREICTAKNPHCKKCPLLKICQFENKEFSDKELNKEKSFMLLDNV